MNSTYLQTLPPPRPSIATRAGQADAGGANFKYVWLALGRVDSKDSLLRANQIQDCVWEAVLGVTDRLVLSDAHQHAAAANSEPLVITFSILVSSNRKEFL